jgi:glutaminyl-peptide cyclotransferase
MEDRLTRHSARTLIVLVIFLFACGPEGPPPEYVPEQPKARSVPQLSYTVERVIPHDPTAFTEGLFFYNGRLFESTGAPDHMPNTRSTFGVVDTNTGKLQVKVELDKKVYFGEGLAALNDKLYWVNLYNQTCFVYDANNFRKLAQFSYANKEGWGMATFGDKLVMSDGTFNLTFFDPTNFTPVRTLAVTRSGYGLDHLNELEVINGFIYANVWMTNSIVKIDPSSGEVVGQLDLTELYDRARRSNPGISEMNGIAYDTKNNRVLVTGKMWSEMYQIRFPW